MNKKAFEKQLAKAKKYSDVNELYKDLGLPIPKVRKKAKKKAIKLAKSVKLTSKVWLKAKHKSGTWIYGLGRLETGEIVVAECFSCLGGSFGIVGSNNMPGKDHLNFKLYPGEKRKIVQDLYIACEQWLKKNKVKIGSTTKFKGNKK